jgi:hypothetical protein
VKNWNTCENQYGPDLEQAFIEKFKLDTVLYQNSLKGAKDVTKVIDFAQVSRFHTPNNTGLVRKANKSG